jgi:hypothetical protein
MPPADGSLSAPGQGPVRSTLSRLRRSFDAAPLPVKVLIVIACCIVCVPFAAFGILAGLIFAPYAVWTGRRDGWATASAGLWGLVLVTTQVHGAPHGHALIALPVIAALLAHARAGPVVRALPHSHLGDLAGLLPGIAAFRLVGKGHSLSASPGLAPHCGGSRLAPGQGLAGQPSEPQLQQVRSGGPGAAWPGQAVRPRARTAGAANGLVRRAWPASQRPGARPGAGGATRGRARGHQGDGVRADRPHRAWPEQPPPRSARRTTTR